MPSSSEFSDAEENTSDVEGEGTEAPSGTAWVFLVAAAGPEVDTQTTEASA